MRTGKQQGWKLFIFNANPSETERRRRRQRRKRSENRGSSQLIAPLILYTFLLPISSTPTPTPTPTQITAQSNLSPTICSVASLPHEPARPKPHRASLWGRPRSTPSATTHGARAPYSLAHREPLSSLAGRGGMASSFVAGANHACSGSRCCCPARLNASSAAGGCLSGRTPTSA